MRFALLLGLAIALVPSLARARAMPEPPAPPPVNVIPQITISGGVAANRSLEVRCERPAPMTARCTITLELDVVATSEEGARFDVPDLADGPVTVDPRFVAEPPPDPSDLYRQPAIAMPRYRVPPSERAHVRVVAVRSFAASRPENRTDYLLWTDALHARHLFLATRSPRMGGALPMAPGRFESPLFGEEAPVEGPLRVRATLPEGVSLAVDGVDVRGESTVDAGRSLALVLDPGPQDEALFRHGGPFLGAGISTVDGEESERFLLRAGYELGLHDWVIGSIALESDFETRFTGSLLIELATPPLFVLIFGAPSFSGGIGATWDISEQGHRAGVRFSAGAGLPVAGVQGTFDYYPEGDEWVVALVGRASL